MFCDYQNLVVQYPCRIHKRHSDVCPAPKYTYKDVREHISVPRLRADTLLERLVKSQASVCGNLLN